MTVVDHPLSSDALSPGKPREYSHKPYIVYILPLRPYSMGSHIRAFVAVKINDIGWLHSNFCDGFQGHLSLTFEKECLMAVQSHPISLIFTATKTRMWLPMINSNFGPVLHFFWDTATYWPKTANFLNSTLILRPRSGRTLSNFLNGLTRSTPESWGYLAVKILLS